MVHPFDLEPSTIRAYSVEGSALDIEPSMISTTGVDGSPLDIEPSMISAFNMEGSVVLYRTIRDMALQHGRFASEK